MSINKIKLKFIQGIHLRNENFYSHQNITHLPCINLQIVINFKHKIFFLTLIEICFKKKIKQNNNYLKKYINLYSTDLKRGFYYINIHFENFINEEVFSTFPGLFVVNLSATLFTQTQCENNSHTIIKMNQSINQSKS
ncbi:hypothetical protein BpHYR1_029093 [Brachionus plicatilis]|uniref:Uncharacterized protein n=1 Tax=Brachionus plicatilis TaxID=10195 RepID=A0A3M7Q5C1_BRAPC|nr:hypothetical protein BpHYR1_029093 [Brachionus plicatilis]